MIIVVAVSLILAVVLVWALYTEEVPPRVRVRPARIGVDTPGAQLRRHGFPLVLAGYEPSRVNAHLKQIAVVHDQLRTAAAGGAGHPVASARDLAAVQSLLLDRIDNTRSPGSVLDD